MLALAVGATELKAPTIAAFDSYVRATEARLAEQRRNGHFLWADSSPDRLAQIKQGLVVIQPVGGKGDREVPDGLVHDWIGAVFIPGATLERTLAHAQDYDHHKSTHKPEVLDSKLLSRDGDNFKVFLRVSKKKVITVVLNTEHDVHYFRIDSTRWASRSYSTRIAEVDNPGRKDERELPVGRDHGFLWRLYSYWRFEERDGGVYVECEALSLTRDIPTGLGWLIEPIIRNLPRESLINTLRATRDSVAARETASE